MFDLIQKGGPIMWPLLITSIISLTVVLERAYFIVTVMSQRDTRIVDYVLGRVEKGEMNEAIRAGQDSKDYVARALSAGLKERGKSLSAGLLRAANNELKRFNMGLSTLDTVITLAPLLGLLGTVTGMIRAFGLLGARELDAPTVITGGIAEALIATAFGLGIAVIALIPFNFLNARMEEARHELEDAGTHLELLLKPAHEL